MLTDKLERFEILDLIKIALNEDMGGYGDITSKFLISPESRSCAYIVCKEEGDTVLCGQDVAAYIFEEISPEIRFKKMKQDCEILNKMDIISEIEGSTQKILAAERTCLNFLQHMSGVATLTRKFVQIASKYDVKIVDTRKTKPLLRKIEKYAVFCGGGFNHRFGLFDGVLIKDNHITAAGGVRNAISQIRSKIPHQLKIEVEIKDFTELEEALEEKADIIMLDNMSSKDVKQASELIRQRLGRKCIIEVSGGITLKNIEEMCETGIDIISIGYLTHSASAVDFSLEFK